MDWIHGWVGIYLFRFIIFDYSFLSLFFSLFFNKDELIKTKISFYFYKSNFHLCFNGLIDYIEMLQSNNEKVTSSNSNCVLNWNEKQVDQWLKSKNLNNVIIDHIRPCNGSILFELYLLSIDAPNYLYQHISKFNDDEDVINDNELNDKILITIGDFTLFKKYLKELFE